jgi:hypothetical protein
MRRMASRGRNRFAPSVTRSGVSFDPARTGQLAEHPVTDVLRNADVHAYGHAKRRYNRLHPRPTLARRRRPISPDRAIATGKGTVS